MTVVATLELASQVAEDFERIFEHFSHYSPDKTLERLSEIIDGLELLTRHPLIGRAVAGGLHELVLGAKSVGYLALYQYSAELEIVFILAIRTQREAGYIRQDKK